MLTTLQRVPDTRPTHPGPGQWSLPWDDAVPDEHTPRLAAARTSPRSDLPVVPSLAERAQRLLQAAAEVGAGVRPLPQLAGMLSPEVYEEMKHRLDVLGRVRTASPHRTTPARVVSVRVQHPRPGTAEVTARLQHGTRSRAVAARLDLDLDRRRPAWLCTALVWV